MPVLAAVLAGAVAAGAATVLAQPPDGAVLAMSGTVRAAADPAGAGHAVPGLAGSGLDPASAAAGAPGTEQQPPAPQPPASQPVPPPQPPPPRTSSPAVAAAVSRQQQVVDLVNAERAAAGCRPLAVDQRLVNAAQAHSTDMAVNSYFSHTSLDGRTFDERILAAGYPRPAAENIAMGQRSAADVMRDWMRSRGHRENILNCGFVTIGVGLDTRGWYWTQDFGR